MAKTYPKNRKKRRPLVIQNCRECGGEFYAKQSNIEVGRGLFCSLQCQRTGRKTRSDKKPRVPHVCQWCGDVFIDANRQRENTKYCSKKCRGLSKNKKRRENHRYKQTAALISWARAVILRDKKCMRCGARENLQAHHVKSYAKHPDNRLDVSNGVALCAVCHHTQHPSHRLGLYLSRGGKMIQRCVYCEGEYLPRRKTQRVCSISCGQKLRHSAGYGD